MPKGEENDQLTGPTSSRKVTTEIMLIEVPWLVLVSTIEIVFKTFFAIGIVLLSQFIVAQDFIGTIDAHELGMGIGISLHSSMRFTQRNRLSTTYRSFIWMFFECQAFEGTSDVALRRWFRNAQ